MKIDIHTHIMPATYPDLKKKFGYGGWIYLDHYTEGRAKMMKDDGTFFREVEQNCFDPVAILPDMDAHNVDIMVLSTIPVLFSYWAKPQDCLDWSRYVNDDMAKIQQDHPKRFIGFGTLPMQSPTLAVKELERCVNDLGLKGVEIGSNINNINLSDSRFDEFFAAAEELDTAIMIHPWNMMGKSKMEKYWLPWLVGMPAETSRAIASMIFGGVYDRYPNLRTFFCHAGGSFPITYGRIQHGYDCRPDLCALDVEQAPNNYIGNFWIDSITHDAKVLKFIIDVMGEDKILYGTDYPFPLGDLEHGKMLEEMPDISQETKDKLLFKNAVDFLKINIEDYKN